MSEQEKQYYRNLLDAGCPAKRADEYMALFFDGKIRNCCENLQFTVVNCLKNCI